MINNIILFQSKRAYIKNAIYINCEKKETLFEEIQAIPGNHINIYDKTYNPRDKRGEIIGVGDHINQTGNNPLIGNQHKLEEQFIDISMLYKEAKGVTTTCIGKHYEKMKKNHNYPSTYLCQAAIVAKATGKRKINGFLINIFS